MCLLKIFCSGCPFGKHLSMMSMKFKGQVGLYRDDGLAVCKATAKQIEKTKQEVSEIFKSNDLKITIEANKKAINFLDVTSTF